MNETPSRILVVDDEPSITEFVGYALKKEGFQPDVVDNGEDALAMAQENDYDLFVLDIMLPGMDGYELCRRLRTKTSAPVLFLSARDTELDKVVGLEIGGDDYLAKPFGVRELIARVRALLRRSQGNELTANSHAITASGITLDEDAHTATGPAGDIDLTPREFELMACLMKNAGKVVSREELLRDAWGWEYLTETKTVDTHIKRLRDKIEQAGYDPGLVETVAVTDIGSSYKTAADIFRTPGHAAQPARSGGDGRRVHARVRRLHSGPAGADPHRRGHLLHQPAYRAFPVRTAQRPGEEDDGISQRRGRHVRARRPHV